MNNNDRSSSTKTVDTLPRELLLNALRTSPLLAGSSVSPEEAISDEALQILRDGAEKLHLRRGDVVVQQGESGSKGLFIVETGRCDILVSKLGKEPIKVSEVHAGQAFGELAFIYDQPRAATVVVSDRDAYIWKVDEYALRRFLADAAPSQLVKTIHQKKVLRAMVERDPSGLFAALDDEIRREQLIAAFEPVHVAKGQAVVRQNQPDDRSLYLVEQGRLDIFVEKPPAGTPARRVATIGPGEYFGELSLLFGTPRGATVVATEDSLVWKLSPDSFHRVLNVGSVVLRRVFEEHASVVSPEMGGQRYMTIDDFIAACQSVWSRGLVDKDKPAGGATDKPNIHVGFLRLAFRAADATGSRLLSFHEFARLAMTVAMATPATAEYELAFRFFDVDHDGFISREEFHTMLELMLDELGVSGDQAARAAAYTLHDAVFPRDTDRLSYDEFQRLVREGRLPGMGVWQRVAEEMRSVLISSAWVIKPPGAADLTLDENVLSTLPTRSKPTAPVDVRMAMRSLLAGGVAGAVSRTAVAPLIRLTVLTQTQPPPPAPPRYGPGVVRGIRQMLVEDGVRGLFKGNGANVARIAPQSAMHFFFYEALSTLFGSTRGISSKTASNTSQQSLERLLFGGVAGAMATALTYPLDLVRARLTVQTSAMQHTASPNSAAPIRGIFNGIVTIARTEGIKALYRGLGPTLVGVFPYMGIDFAVYESLKPHTFKNKKTGEPTPLGLLLCGGAAGFVSQTVAFPLEVVRRRMQVAGFGYCQGYGFDAQGRRLGMLGVLMHTWRTEGIRGLYRGLWPNYVKAVPAMGIGFVTYETVRKWFK